jgi:hypothetical protein
MNVYGSGGFLDIILFLAKSYWIGFVSIFDDTECIHLPSWVKKSFGVTGFHRKISSLKYIYFSDNWGI